ncbi:hypothetical protein G8S55_13100 [Clostridium botulinum C]|uniref:hypothetical protein n=1 Tax=Clostridium botulinum TaxID=1491 RepID=UPI001E32C8D0|nr:hypothetical protein [Clostridium botulinum]MCD3218131.1 hypothetical protein [Clostridium botulinum C]
MNLLTKLELKKIRCNKAVKGACFLLILYILIAVIGSIHSAYSYTTNTTEPLKGMKAIKQNKLYAEKTKGYLDDKKIENVINYYYKLKSNKNNVDSEGFFKNEAYINWAPYGDIQSLIATSYSDIKTYDYKIIDKLTPNNSKQFYGNRVKKIKDFLELDYEYSHFNKADAKAIMKEAKNLSTPMYYDYTDGWSKLMDNFFFLNIGIILILCFSVCNVFTEDIYNGMSLVVLPTIHGKSKLAASKIKASIMFSSIAYLIFNGLFAGSLLMFYGAEGWNCQFQIIPSYFLSVYNVKFYQGYILAIIVGLCALLFMITLTLLLSNILKKAFITMGTVTVLLLGPILLTTDKLTRIPTNIIELLPVKAINFGYTLRQQSMYNVFGTEILRGYITPIILLILSIILIPFIVKLYNKQQA